MRAADEVQRSIQRNQGQLLETTGPGFTKLGGTRDPETNSQSPWKIGRLRPQKETRKYSNHLMFRWGRVYMILKTEAWKKKSVKYSVYQPATGEIVQQIYEPSTLPLMIQFNKFNNFLVVIWSMRNMDFVHFSIRFWQDGTTIKRMDMVWSRDFKPQQITGNPSMDSIHLTQNRRETFFSDRHLDTQILLEVIRCHTVVEACVYRSYFHTDFHISILLL